MILCIQRTNNAKKKKKKVFSTMFLITYFQNSLKKKKHIFKTKKTQLCVWYEFFFF